MKKGNLLSNAQYLELFQFVKIYVHYNNIVITNISIIVIIEFLSASHEYLKHSSILSCKLSRVLREDIHAILRNVNRTSQQGQLIVNFKSIVCLTKNHKVIHI